MEEGMETQFVQVFRGYHCQDTCCNRTKSCQDEEIDREKPPKCFGI